MLTSVSFPYKSCRAAFYDFGFQHVFEGTFGMARMVSWSSSGFGDKMSINNEMVFVQRSSRRESTEVSSGFVAVERTELLKLTICRSSGTERCSDRANFSAPTPLVSELQSTASKGAF